MNLNGKRVFVTGGCGFIGSHLIEELIKRNCEVTCLVEYNPESDLGLLKEVSQEITSKVNFVYGNILDVEFLKKVLENQEYVFHLAAIISIPYSYTSPRHTVETNIIGTLNVLEAVRQNKIKKVMHTSTSEVYGTAQYVPIDEKHPLVGQSPYSASKIGADKIAESFYSSFGVPVVTARPFNCYGPRQSMRAVTPTIIVQALSNKDIHLGNLSTTRDYTYVKDTVLGMIAVMEKEGNEGQVYNLCSNFEISIQDLAKKVIALTNPVLKIISEKDRFRPKDSEVERLWGSNEKAKLELLWKPKYSYEDGLKETINYFKIKSKLMNSEVYHI